MKKALVTCCLNNLDVTKKFLNSVVTELNNEYDLYILDNGSCDGTFDYIDQFSIDNNKDVSKPFIYFKKTDINRGFAAGNNILLDWVLRNNTNFKYIANNFYSSVTLINNDTLITKESLDLLDKVCNSSDTIGAVGPISNYVAGMQRVNVQGLTPENYATYAKQLAKSTEIHTEEIGTLIGFCMCIKMSALKETGLLDEQFGVGMYEDNDYSLRLRNNGYRLLFVKQSLIYHYGSQTIKDFNMNDLLIVNKEKFIKKHKLECARPLASILVKKDESSIHERFFKTPVEATCLGKKSIDVPQEVFKSIAETSDWCILEYDDDFLVTLPSDTISQIHKIIENTLPGIDLIKFKIVHFKDDGSIDLSEDKGAHWEGRILRIRKKKDGTYIGFNEVPKDAQSYAYVTICKFTLKNPNKLNVYKTGSNTISASYIVKNESKYIRQSLESIKDLVDEIVIVDTGSTDSTKEICKQYTDKIYDYKWNDSFADARNFSLSKCTGNWILRLDGDEIVPTETAVNIYNAIVNQEGDMYMVPIKNIQPDGSAPMSMTLRVFRNVPGLKYTGRVHEEISESAKKLGLKMLKINNHLMHYGYLKGTQAKKTDMYFKLLMLDYQDNPKDSATCMNLANHYVHQGQYETAISFYKECIDCLNNKIDPIIYHDYGVSLYKLFLSKHQSEIKEILDVLDKVKQTIDLCYPEQKERFNKNYNIISNMILTK